MFHKEKNVFRFAPGLCVFGLGSNLQHNPDNIGEGESGLLNSKWFSMLLSKKKKVVFHVSKNLGRCLSLILIILVFLQSLVDPNITKPKWYYVKEELHFASSIFSCLLISW